MASSPGRPWSLAAATLGAVMLIVYISLIVSEGGNSFWAVLPWALWMGGAAVLALVSIRIADRRRAGFVLLGSAILFGGIGLLSLFTIGLGFLLAGGLAGIGALRLLSAPAADQVAG